MVNWSNVFLLASLVRLVFTPHRAAARALAEDGREMEEAAARLVP